MSANYPFDFTTAGGGGGTFPAGSRVAMGDGGCSVRAGGYDGDVDLDLAVGVYNVGYVSVRLNNGSGTFAFDGDYTVSALLHLLVHIDEPVGR